jgi:hypothetical protein
MLTGTRAWAGLSHAAVVLQVSVLGRELEVPAGLPPALDALLRSALSRDPSARPTFAAAADALAAWLQDVKGQDLSGTPVGRRAPEGEGGGEAAAPPCAAACARA